MAAPAFDTDADKTLENKTDPQSPQPDIAPNQVAVNPDPGTPASGLTQETTPGATSGTGESKTSSADAQPAGAGTTGSGPSASGGAPPAPAPVSNIPGPGSQPASTAGAAGPGSQPATVPPPAPAPPPAGGGPTTAPPPAGMQVTAGANGASYVTPSAGNTQSPTAPDNSSFTDTTQTVDRDKHKDATTGDKVYGVGEVQSNVHRDADGNIATNENLAGPEKYTPKTSARSDGAGGSIVDYVKFGPDGRPMSPAEDIAGWNKLTPEQQTSALTEYKRNLTDYLAKKNGPTASGLDQDLFNPDTWKDQPDEARLAAVDAALTGRKTDSDAAAAKKLDTPTIVTNADGSVTMASWVDSKGNPISPYSDPNFKNLTHEQQTSLMNQFAANAETVANGGTIGEDQDFMGTGMAESAFKQMPPKDQAWMYNNPGFQPPEHHADGSTSYTEKPADGATDSHSYTMDKDGRKTSEYYPAGTFSDEPVTFTYGADGVSGTTTIGNRVTTRDSQGNDTTVDNDTGWVTTSKDGTPVISAKPGTPAAASADADYGPDGKKLTLTGGLAARLGIPESELTQEQIDSVHNTANKIAQSPEGYAYGKTVGTLALEAGLITQQEFDTIDGGRNTGSSWGAWLATNPDMERALTGTGLTQDQIKDMSAHSYFQVPTGMRTGDVNEDLLGRMRTKFRPDGETKADKLSGVNLGSITDPQSMYDQAFNNIQSGASFHDVVRPSMGAVMNDGSLSPQAKAKLINEIVQRAGYSDPSDPTQAKAVNELVTKNDGQFSLKEQAQVKAWLMDAGGWRF